MKLAATGWLTLGRAPMTMTKSESSTALKGAETAPDERFSMSAATEDA